MHKSQLQAYRQAAVVALRQFAHDLSLPPPPPPPTAGENGNDERSYIQTCLDLAEQKRPAWKVGTGILERELKATVKTRASQTFAAAVAAAAKDKDEADAVEEEEHDGEEEEEGEELEDGEEEGEVGEVQPAVPDDAEDAAELALAKKRKELMAKKRAFNKSTKSGGGQPRKKAKTSGSGVSKPPARGRNPRRGGAGGGSVKSQKAAEA